MTEWIAYPENGSLSFTKLSPTEIHPTITSFSAGKFCGQQELNSNNPNIASAPYLLFHIFISKFLNISQRLLKNVTEYFLKRKQQMKSGLHRQGTGVNCVRITLFGVYSHVIAP